MPHDGGSPSVCAVCAVCPVGLGRPVGGCRSAAISETLVLKEPQTAPASACHEVQPSMPGVALIRLRGKHAVGPYAHAIVDADLFEVLNRYAWKAKPNARGTHIYAVRNAVNDAGKSITIRMHRLVLGYSGPLDIDHRNRNTVDNRRSNLRTATRSENVKNSAQPRRPPRQKPKPKPSRPVLIASCAECGGDFERRRLGHLFCSEPCRKRAKWRRQFDAAQLPRSASRFRRFFPEGESAGGSDPVAALLHGSPKGVK